MPDPYGSHVFCSVKQDKPEAAAVFLFHTSLCLFLVSRLLLVNLVDLPISIKPIHIQAAVTAHLHAGISYLF